MANTLFDKGREKFLNGQISWGSDTIRVALIDTNTYTITGSEEFYSEISTGVVGGFAYNTNPTITTKTYTNGVADGADVVFSAVTGATVEKVVIYKEGASAAASPLIAQIDNAGGLPLTPNGEDVTITWSNGTYKIFKL